MKKLFVLLLALLMVLSLVACGTNQPTQPNPPLAPPEEPEDAEPFPGIIAIVTHSIDQNEETYRSAEALVQRFGADKVIHKTWPITFGCGESLTIAMFTELASNPEVGAIVINQALWGTSVVSDAVRDIRDDIFIVVASAVEDPADVYARVDLSLDINNPGIPEIFVQQAIEMGAETIAHYSFPRHMAIPMLAARRDGLRYYAEAAGLRFVELSSPDPMEYGGMAESQLFISQDVGRQVAELGENTVFFSTNCRQHIPLLQQVLEHGAMFVQPCCPSPFHAFPQALGLAAEGEEAVGLYSVSEIIDLTRAVIIEADMQGRLSNWALPGSMAYTWVGFMYAVEWLNGRVSQERGYVDETVLLRLFGDYAEEVLGERMYPILSQLRIGDDVFSTMYVVIMPYIVY